MIKKNRRNSRVLILEEAIGAFKRKIDELESMGGNPHVADTDLAECIAVKSVDIFSMKIKKGDHLQHCPIAQSVM